MINDKTPDKLADIIRDTWPQIFYRDRKIEKRVNQNLTMTPAEAGFDGKIRIPHIDSGWILESDFYFQDVPDPDFDSLTNAIKAGRTKRNTFSWTEKDEKLFYLNREGELYEVSFNKIDYI